GLRHVPDAVLVVVDRDDPLGDLGDHVRAVPLTTAGFQHHGVPAQRQQRPVGGFVPTEPVVLFLHAGHRPLTAEVQLDRPGGGHVGHRPAAGTGTSHRAPCGTTAMDTNLPVSISRCPTGADSPAITERAVVGRSGDTAAPRTRKYSFAGSARPAGDAAVR